MPNLSEIEQITSRFGGKLNETQVSAETISGKVRFEFSSDPEKHEKVAERLRSIAEGKLRFTSSTGMLKYWAYPDNKPHDFVYASYIDVRGVCYPQKIPDIVKALATSDMWTTVSFWKSKMGKNVSQLGEEEPVNIEITPELKQKLQP